MIISDNGPYHEIFNLLCDIYFLNCSSDLTKETIKTINIDSSYVDDKFLDALEFALYKMNGDQFEAIVHMDMPTSEYGLWINEHFGGRGEYFFRFYNMRNSFIQYVKEL